MDAVAETLMSAESYWRLGRNAGYSELVEGRIVPMNPPGFRHGRVGYEIGFIVKLYLQQNDIGRVAGLDCGVITHRDPDTVRGADALYYSYQRLPVDVDPEGYPEVPPEIVWEVMSPSDRWKDVLGKVHEYLEAGVLVVCVIDLTRELWITYYPDRPDVQLTANDHWTEPDLLPGLSLPLDRIFKQVK